MGVCSHWEVVKRKLNDDFLLIHMFRIVSYQIVNSMRVLWACQLTEAPSRKEDTEMEVPAEESLWEMEGSSEEAEGRG